MNLICQPIEGTLSRTHRTAQAFSLFLLLAWHGDLFLHGRSN
jgi:hypothetical protein